MSKFSIFIFQSLNLSLTAILLFTSSQFPVFAQENKTQTGNIILTETDSTLLEETSTGENILEQIQQPQIETLTGSGLLPITEEEVIETGSILNIDELKITKVNQKNEIKFKKNYKTKELILSQAACL